MVDGRIISSKGRWATPLLKFVIVGDPPADSTIRPTMDVRVCGASLVDRTIVRRGKGGRIEITFKTEEELNRIFEKITEP